MISHICRVLKSKTDEQTKQRTYRQRTDCLAVARGQWVKMGEEGQDIQISVCKINNEHVIQKEKYTPVVDSCQRMAKPTRYCKVK